MSATTGSAESIQVQPWDEAERRRREASHLGVLRFLPGVAVHLGFVFPVGVTLDEDDVRMVGKPVDHPGLHPAPFVL